MDTYMIVILSALGIVLAALIVFLLYFLCSPMPVVRLLRRNLGDDLSVPPEYEASKQKVQIQKDLLYNSDYGKNTFDLYLPKAEGLYPLILWVHGGAFVAGDKSGVENWGVMLAAHGYAVAVMNYAWAPEAAYPAQLQQITEALQAIQKIAKDTGKIDMQRVAVAGDSAGAHMASQFVLIHTNSEFSNRLKMTSPLEKDALKCALLYCGPYNLEKMLTLDNKVLRLFVSRIGWSYLGHRNWKKAPLLDTVTPMHFVTEDYVPTYITDGNSFSFESHGKELAEALRSAGVKVAERYFDKETFGEVSHEYQMHLDTQNAADCFNDTVEFLGSNM